jgi:hypothetical protein
MMGEQTGAFNPASSRRPSLAGLVDGYHFSVYRLPRTLNSRDAALVRATGVIEADATGSVIQAQIKPHAVSIGCFTLFAAVALAFLVLCIWEAVSQLIPSDLLWLPVIGLIAGYTFIAALCSLDITKTKARLYELAGDQEV